MSTRTGYVKGPPFFFEFDVRESCRAPPLIPFCFPVSPPPPPHLRRQLRPVTFFRPFMSYFFFSFFSLFPCFDLRTIRTFPFFLFLLGDSAVRLSFFLLSPPHPLLFPVFPYSRSPATLVFENHFDFSLLVLTSQPPPLIMTINFFRKQRFCPFSLIPPFSFADTLRTQVPVS